MYRHPVDQGSHGVFPHSERDVAGRRVFRGEEPALLDDRLRRAGEICAAADETRDLAGYLGEELATRSAGGHLLSEREFGAFESHILGLEEPCVQVGDLAVCRLQPLPPSAMSLAPSLHGLIEEGIDRIIYVERGVGRISHRFLGEPHLLLAERLAM